MTTPEHYVCRSSGTGAAAETERPLILPLEIVQMLRGERGYTEESKDLAELAISRYQAGYAGHPYKPPRGHGFPGWCVDATDRFLLACWKRGQDDRLYQTAGIGGEVQS